jgi:hypothetical protein
MRLMRIRPAEMTTSKRMILQRLTLVAVDSIYGSHKPSNQADKRRGDIRPFFWPEFYIANVHKPVPFSSTTFHKTCLSQIFKHVDTIAFQISKGIFLARD